jgi:hypothetical protein
MGAGDEGRALPGVSVNCIAFLAHGKGKMRHVMNGVVWYGAVMIGECVVYTCARTQKEGKEIPGHVIGGRLVA